MSSKNIETRFGKTSLGKTLATADRENHLFDRSVFQKGERFKNVSFVFAAVSKPNCSIKFAPWSYGLLEIYIGKVPLLFIAASKPSCKEKFVYLEGRIIFNERFLLDLSNFS